MVVEDDHSRVGEKSREKDCSEKNYENKNIYKESPVRKFPAPVLLFCKQSFYIIAKLKSKLSQKFVLKHENHLTKKCLLTLLYFVSWTFYKTNCFNKSFVLNL
jgi:hypothetical protein